MAKIYAPPIELGFPPKITHPFNFAAYEAACDEYTRGLQAWAKAQGRHKDAGEVITFPVADGCAVYVVLSLKPVELIHVPVGDAWQFQYANRLTATDVRDKIRSAKALAKIFSKA